MIDVNIKEWLQNFLGKESEDAGFKNVSADILKQSIPKVSIPKEQRFIEPTVTRYKG